MRFEYRATISQALLAKAVGVFGLVAAFYCDSTLTVHEA